MEIQELREKLESDLAKGLVSSKVLLNRARLVDDNSRATLAYQDPNYFPFYYHLGKYLQPKSLVEFGFGLGLFATAFFTSCQSVQRFLAFQQKTEGYYPALLAVKNVRDRFSGELDLHQGEPMDRGFLDKLDHKWELAFVSDIESFDTLRLCLDLVWDRMELDGFLVMDHLSKQPKAMDAFVGFCKIKNRKPIILQTRYGTGIIQR